MLKNGLTKIIIIKIKTEMPGLLGNNIKISKKDILIFGTNYEIEKSKEYAKEKIPQFKNK